MIFQVGNTFTVVRILVLICEFIYIPTNKNNIFLYSAVGVAVPIAILILSIIVSAYLRYKRRRFLRCI
jgi:hypothetical protein